MTNQGQRDLAALLSTQMETEQIQIFDERPRARGISPAYRRR
jgi:hypothetical protein